MAEGLTFANFAPALDGLEDIYDIGVGDGSDSGVIPEIAAAFEYELTDTPTVENLGDLIRLVGPAKQLQENIGLVQEALGTDEDAVAITRGWAERSGLLIPVEQSYMAVDALDAPLDLDWAIMTGGMRNWMARRADRIEGLKDSTGIHQALLIAGNRVMKTIEGPDVGEGMTESDYMGTVIRRQLTRRNILTGYVSVDAGDGDEVMATGIQEAVEKLRLFDPSTARLAVVSNAGAWVQNVGQVRRAVQAIAPDFDQNYDQVIAISDEFPLGTGSEPTSTHQNPFSAVGQIVRNAQELVRHMV